MAIEIGPRPTGDDIFEVCLGGGRRRCDPRNGGVVAVRNPDRIVPGRDGDRIDTDGDGVFDLAQRPGSSHKLTVPVDGDTTHTRWKAKTTPVAPGTAASVRGGFLLVGLISETVPFTELGDRSPSAVRNADGPVADVDRLRRQRRCGVDARDGPVEPFATQTEPWPTATPTGPLPTWYVWLGALEPASIRATVSASGFVTQVAPSPTATPPGEAPAENVDAT